MPRTIKEGGLTGSFPGAADIFQRGHQDLLKRTFEGGADLQHFHLKLSSLTDDYFRARLSELEADGAGYPLLEFAVIAVGGYGRKELCLESDIDVLVLFEKKIPDTAEELCRGLFFPLWDLGLDLGHGVRNIKGCLKLAADDPQVFTSLVTARFTAGSNSVFETFQSKWGRLVKKKQKKIISWLKAQSTVRQDRNGETGSLLEPELKTGHGGLRDYHQILWLRAMMPAIKTDTGHFPFDRQDLELLMGSVSFLLRTRSALHHAAGRRLDRLHLDLQPSVSSLLGFSGQSGKRVERFLSRLHKAMSRIRIMNRVVWDVIDQTEHREGRKKMEITGTVGRKADGLYFLDQEEVLARPEQVLDLFVLSSKTGIRIAWDCFRFLEDNAHQFAGTLSVKESGEKLLQILKSPDGYAAARQLMDCTLLGGIIPEFALVENFVQFDAYHLYPVGLHSLETVRRLKCASDEGSEIFQEVSRRVNGAEALIWAGLLHDLGKGGGDHARKGGQLSRKILGRFGRDSDVIADTAFLIEHHLSLFVAATRIDLNDETAVSSLAEEVGTTRRLDMLYLLSVADAQATGPKAWNDWVGQLLNELYFKLRKIMSTGILSRPDAVKTIQESKKTVASLAGERFSPECVQESLAHMASRYLITVSPRDIVAHMELLASLKEEEQEEKKRMPGQRGGIGLIEYTVRNVTDQGHYEITIAARDKSRLFATICGVLALHDLNILSADIYTWSNGTVIDIFKVGNLPDTLYPDELWSRVKRGIKYAFTGKLSLEYRLNEKSKSPLFEKPAGTGLDPAIFIDNKASDFYTVIEIVADDRLGRLYEIADTFDHMQIQVHMAKISTKADRIVDVFYVRDGLGQKLEDQAQVQELTRAVLHRMRQR